jgi:hypothetical protein
LSARIPHKNLQRRKAHLYSALKKHMSQLPGEASQKTKPAQNRFPEATAISHIKRHNVTINRNRNAIYHFRSIAIMTQSECPLRFRNRFNFPAVQ